jgi:hypothetical protein
VAYYRHLQAYHPGGVEMLSVKEEADEEEDEITTELDAEMLIMCYMS